MESVLIGLGCGGGKKDAICLSKLKIRSGLLHYVPCDVSQAMTLIAREEVGKNLIGEYGWLVVAGFAALLLKNTIGNMVAGAMFMFGPDFDEDDIVYIGGKKKARINDAFPQS